MAGIREYNELNNGIEETIPLPVTPSTNFAYGDFVTPDSGKLIPHPSGSTEPAGRILEEISSSDSDYANDREVKVALPRGKNNIYEMQVDQAPNLPSQRFQQFDFEDAKTVDFSGGAGSSKPIKLLKELPNGNVLVHVLINGSF